MPRRKYKGSRPGANLPADLKAPFLIDSSSDEPQFVEKCRERLIKLLKHYSIRDGGLL
jgi:hypothetical protein